MHSLTAQLRARVSQPIDLVLKTTEQLSSELTYVR